MIRALAVHAEVGPLLCALAASPAIDAGTLICLSGRWADGSTIIAWAPTAVLIDADLDALDSSENTIGWIDHTGTSWFGVFDRLLRREPDGHWSLVGGTQELAAVIEKIPIGDVPEPVTLTGLTVTGRDSHLAAVERTVTAIRAGELLQANICARFTGQVDGAPVALFAAGLMSFTADYAAFLQTPEKTLVSFSPEQFLDVRGREVRTSPIKGTRPRGDDPEDPAASELLHSVKDRAENVMIVDLMRNDLGRVCEPGSVTVGALLSVRPAPGVWHLVSEVTGRLRPEQAVADLLRACLPPGSVTGAPKHRALRLIDELESAARGTFTGAIGYLVSGRAEFSVAIRTFEIVGTRFELGVGGGITADSVPVAEWRECLAKAAPLLALGGAIAAEEDPGVPSVVDARRGLYDTMLAIDGEVIASADHLDRLGASCQEMFGLRLPDDLADRVRAAVAGTTGRRRIRVTAGPERGSPLIEIEPVPTSTAPSALYCHHGRSGSWRHKWADRRWLVEQETAAGMPLFVGPDDEVHETSRGSVAVLTDSGWRTPPATDELLPGVTRRLFLDALADRGERIDIGPVGVAELRGARLVLHLSSIAGAVAVRYLDGVELAVDDRVLGDVRSWLGF